MAFNLVKTANDNLTLNNTRRTPLDHVQGCRHLQHLTIFRYRWSDGGIFVVTASIVIFILVPSLVAALAKVYLASTTGASWPFALLFCTVTILVLWAVCRTEHKACSTQLRGGNVLILAHAVIYGFVWPSPMTIVALMTIPALGFALAGLCWRSWYLAQVGVRRYVAVSASGAILMFAGVSLHEVSVALTPSLEDDLVNVSNGKQTQDP